MRRALKPSTLVKAVVLFCVIIEQFFKPKKEVSSGPLRSTLNRNEFKSCMILICKADPGCLTNLENTTSSPEILRPSDHRLLVLASIMWMSLRLCLLTLLKCSWMLERSISEALKKLTNSLLRNTLERQPEYGSRVPLWKVTYPLSSSLWITASKVSIPKSFW